MRAKKEPPPCFLSVRRGNAALLPAPHLPGRDGKRMAGPSPAYEPLRLRRGKGVKPTRPGRSRLPVNGRYGRGTRHSAGGRPLAGETARFCLHVRGIASDERVNHPAIVTGKLVVLAELATVLLLGEVARQLKGQSARAIDPCGSASSA